MAIANMTICVGANTKNSAILNAPTRFPNIDIKRSTVKPASIVSNKLQTNLFFNWPANGLFKIIHKNSPNPVTEINNRIILSMISG